MSSLAVPGVQMYHTTGGVGLHTGVSARMTANI